MNTLRLNRVALAMREKVAETGWQNASNAFQAWRENNTATRQRGDDWVRNTVQARRENNTAARQRGDDRVGNTVAGWFGGGPAGRATVAPPTAPAAQSAAPAVPVRAPTPAAPTSSSAPVRSSGVGAAMGAKDAARFSVVAPASPAAPASTAAPVDTTPALAHDMTTSRLEASIKRNAAPTAPTAQAAPAAPAAGGEKKQFSSYWQMAKAMNEGVTDPSKRVSAAELSKKFDGKMIQKGDTFDLNAIRGGTYAGASGAKGSFDKWQAARTAKAAPAAPAASPTAGAFMPTGLRFTGAALNQMGSDGANRASSMINSVSRGQLTAANTPIRPTTNSAAPPASAATAVPRVARPPVSAPVAGAPATLPPMTVTPPPGAQLTVSKVAPPPARMATR